MTTRQVGLIVLATLATSGAAQAQQKVLKGHAASPTVSVKLFAAVGSVRVIGWDRDSVELSGVVPASAHAEMSGGPPDERVKGIKMFVENENEQTGRGGKLVLHVPRGARLWLKTGSANIDVTGVTGGLDLNVVGGSIDVHGNPRELRAESMDGNVVVDGIPDWMRVKTATGDITIKGGQDVGASTISGTIRSSGGEVERVKLESTTGAIILANKLSRNASVEVESHSGAIDLAIDQRADVELDASTITGTIENTWTRGRPVAGREGRGMTLTTSSGMGSARIVVRSFKGTVKIAVR